MKRQKLLLTGLGETLTKEAQEKLNKETQGVSTIEDLTCENGRTREQYENLGMRVPDDLIEKEKNFEVGIKIEDEDYEEVYSEVLVFVDQIRLIVEDDVSTVLFLNDGLTVNVVETRDEIFSYIEYLERGWFDRFKDSVSNFFREIKK